MGSCVHWPCLLRGGWSASCPAFWWHHTGGLCPLFAEATGELRGFLRVSQAPLSILAHHALHSVGAAHAFSGAELLPTVVFSLSLTWGGSKRPCPLGSPHPISAPPPCSGVLKPTSSCPSLSALPEAVLASGVRVEGSWLTHRGPLIKILKRPPKNMSAVTCTSMCIFYIFYVLMSSLPTGG